MPRSESYTVEEFVGIGFQSLDEASEYFETSGCSKIDGTDIKRWEVPVKKNGKPDLSHQLHELDKLVPGKNCEAIVLIPFHAKSLMDRIFFDSFGIETGPEDHKFPSFAKREWMKYLQE